MAQGIKSNIFRDCLECSKKFKTIEGEIRKGGGKYCSLSCRSKFYNRENIEIIKKRLEPYWKDSMLRNLPTGEKHWAWITDRSKVKRQERRDNPLYKAWRKEVFARDNFRCLWCGEYGKINADHILSWAEYPRLRFDINNGQTLCIACHHVKTRSQLSGKKLIFTY